MWLIVVFWSQYVGKRTSSLNTMAYAAMKQNKPGLEEPQEQIHKIRITLSSKNVKNLEKGICFCLLYLF